MIRKILCLLGFHLYMYSRLSHYMNISWGSPGEKGTEVIFKCKYCRKVKVKHYGGKVLKPEDYER